MADKFIQMAQRNTGNTDWDNLYPQDKFETAGGTATAITLTIPNLVDGISKTFIVSANNNGAVTTINGKSLYKPNSTTAPTLIAGKAYTVWYKAANTCFFIKASAEGNAGVGDVLAGKIFSNDTDIGLVGTATIESLGGKKWASGTFNGTLDATPHNIELSFTPNLVMIGFKAGSYNRAAYTINEDMISNLASDLASVWMSGISQYDLYPRSDMINISTNSISITLGGSGGITPVSWIAYE